MIIRATAALLGICFALAAIADDAEPAETLREFNVEIIIFTYAQEVSVGSEVFVPDEPPPIEPVALDDSIDINEELPAVIEDLPMVDEEFSDEPDIPEFSILTQADLQMLEIADRMRRLDVYEVLLHAGWTQVARPKDESMTMQLEMLAPLPEELSGEFTLYLSRFLHLIADLELDAPGNNALPVAIEQPRGREMERAVQPVAPIHYRIQEDRIFRSDETRYYDHPKFGVVARITRYEAPVPEEIEVLPGDSISPTSPNN